MDEFADEDVIIEADLRYSTNILEGILSAAADHQVDAIVFRPRDTNRLAKLVSGDLAHKLLMNPPIQSSFFPHQMQRAWVMNNRITGPVGSIDETTMTYGPLIDSDILTVVMRS